MTAKLSLSFGEKIVWQGTDQNVVCSKCWTLVVVSACLATAATAVSVIEPVAVGAAAAIVALLAALIGMWRLRGMPTSYILTDQRIVVLDPKGRFLWRDGSPLARTQDIETQRSLCGKIVVVRTLQEDHGAPTEVRVGPLPAVEAVRLTKVLQALNPAPVGPIQ